MGMPARNQARDARIAERYRAGETMEAIARSLGITRERVRVIVWARVLPHERAVLVGRNRLAAAKWRWAGPEGRAQMLAARLKVPDVWPKRRTERMVSLWMEGLSFAQIADRLGVTRSAVAGKLFREGLTGL